MLKLDKFDIEAIARSRASRGKANLVIVGIGVLWLLGTIVSLIALYFTEKSLLDLTQWLMLSLVIFVLWFGVFTIWIEVRTRKIIDGLKGEINENS